MPSWMRLGTVGVVEQASEGRNGWIGDGGCWMRLCVRMGTGITFVS